jgi:hypothetical protein
VNRHIIHKQKTIVKISRDERAALFQTELSNMFKDEIPQLLETVFDEVAGENEIVRINTLQIDLGVLRAENFKNEFKTQLAEQLKKIIKEKKQEYIFGSDDIIVIKKEQSQQDAFKHFLQFGTKPWFTSIKTLQQWEAEILNDFSSQSWQNISNWLKQNYREQPVILERLVHQFSDEVLIKILKELSSFSENDWRIIYDDLIALYIALSIQQSNIRAGIWHKIFFSFITQQHIRNPLHEAVSAIFKQYHKSKGSVEYLKALSYVSTIVAAKKGDDEVSNDKKPSAFHYPEEIKNLKEKIHSDAVRNAIKDINEDAIKISGESTKNIQSPEKMNKDDATALTKSEDNSEDNIDAPGQSNSDNISDKINIDKSVTKEQDRKSKRNKATDAVEGEIQYVINSGIVILHPFLLTYFDGLGMIKEKKFITIDACKRAALLLHFLATGETAIAEFDLLLQKIICNLSFEETLPAVLEITDTEKEESEKLLLAVINYWPPLKNTSIAGLRNTFLQREGRLEKKEDSWLLTIEQRTVDVLLDKLPWGYSTIQLPWMKERLSVDWC